jgi:hypothetical protein
VSSQGSCDTSAINFLYSTGTVRPVSSLNYQRPVLHLEEIHEIPASSSNNNYLHGNYSVHINYLFVQPPTTVVTTYTSSGACYPSLMPPWYHTGMIGLNMQSLLFRFCSCTTLEDALSLLPPFQHKLIEESLQLQTMQKSGAHLDPKGVLKL